MSFEYVKEDGFKFLNEFESNQYMEEVILEGLVICPTIKPKDKDL